MQSKITEIISGKSGKIYLKCIQPLQYNNPCDFINEAYKKYQSDNVSTPSANGRIFEYLVCETLAQENIFPFFYQAKFTYVPNAAFDIVLYKKKGPIVLTMKTSLRESYKQADLEGMALKQVYRSATSYLVSLSLEEVRGLKQKIKNDDLMGLQDGIVATHKEYNVFLQSLSKMKFEKSEPIIPLEGTMYQCI